MELIKTFRSNLGKLDVLMKDQPYFKGRDIVECLGYAYPSGETLNRVNAKDKIIYKRSNFITINGVKGILERCTMDNKDTFEMWFEWILAELAKETVFVKVTVEEPVLLMEPTPEPVNHPLENYCSNVSPELKAAFLAAMDVMEQLNKKAALLDKIKEVYDSAA